MISKNEVVKRLSSLKFFHLVSYLYECSNNLHIVVIRASVLHPNFKGKEAPDVVVRVKIEDDVLMAQSIKEITSWIKLTEREKA